MVYRGVASKGGLRKFADLKKKKMGGGGGVFE